MSNGFPPPDRFLSIGDVVWFRNKTNPTDPHDENEPLFVPAIKVAPASLPGGPEERWLLAILEPNNHGSVFYQEAVRGDGVGKWMERGDATPSTVEEAFAAMAEPSAVEQGAGELSEEQREQLLAERAKAMELRWKQRCDEARAAGQEPPPRPAFLERHGRPGAGD